MTSEEKVYILPKDGRAGAKKVIARMRQVYGTDLLFPRVGRRSSKPLPPIITNKTKNLEIRKALLPNVPVIITDGSGINYRYDVTTKKFTAYVGKCETTSNVIHDIAHWMVAGKITRRRNEFGLGHSPGDTSLFQIDYANLEFPKNRSLASQAEEFASALGIALEYSLGLRYYDTIEDHSWQDDLENLRKAWKRLQKYCGGEFVTS